MKYLNKSIFATAALVLCSGAMAAAPMADDPTKGGTTGDNNGQSVTQANKNAERHNMEWQKKQWDKAQWDAMNDSERAAYKDEHKKWWGGMTAQEKEEYRKTHKGQKNYMDEHWNNK